MVFCQSASTIPSDFRRVRAGVKSCLEKALPTSDSGSIIMVPAADDMLTELFQVDKSSLPAELAEYFEFE